MLLLSSGIDKYVVYEVYDKLIQERSEDPIHVVHEHNQSIGHTKGHNHILVVAISGPECRLLHIISLYQYLMVSRPQIYL